jgi:hypothetical protein
VYAVLIPEVSFANTELLKKDERDGVQYSKNGQSSCQENGYSIISCERSYRNIMVSRCACARPMPKPGPFQRFDVEAM